MSVMPIVHVRPVEYGRAFHSLGNIISLFGEEVESFSPTNLNSQKR